VTGYSIFADTLADMTWPAVEQAAQANTPLLVPVAVIEQHSWHLPLATDTYAAHLLCSLIKRGLAQAGIASVIAPPYYLGVNSTTGTFPGSFTVRAETMAAVLTETLENCARWGFRRQFVVNHHGDPVHNGAVMRTIRALRAGGVEATLVLGGQALDWVDVARVQGNDAVLMVPCSEKTTAARGRLTKSALDVHAGERETSLVMRFFPETLAPDVDIRGLAPVPETLEQFQDAQSAGGWRALSPQGHMGDPAAATPENGELYELEAADAAVAIAEFLRR
jgi:creatinine amidohydrolase